jgi:hypothetical protein
MDYIDVSYNIVGCVLTEVLGNSSCISCAAVMSVWAVGSFLYRVDGVYDLQSSV